MAKVTVSGIVLRDLADKDGATTTDPYVVVECGGVEAKTITQWNKETAAYSDVLTLDVPNGTFPLTVNIRVLDEDKFSADDDCGKSSFTIAADGKGTHHSELGVLNGKVDLVWEATGPPTAAPEPTPEPAPEPVPEPAPEPQDAPTTAEPQNDPQPEPTPSPEPEPAAPARAVVTRENIMTMSEPAQERFVAAIKQMMLNQDGVPETSEFARLAGYHGYPSHYCHHGQETFPGWHRAYLVEFEVALQAADRALGNDGNIGLPYWDWDDVVNGGGPVLPPLIRKEFTGDIPEGLVKPDFGRQLHERGFNEVRSDAEIRQRMTNSMVLEGMYGCLEQPEHWQHASTRFRRGYSVEDPHNNVHVAIGYPMASVQFAAFHPIFWLHHCQVDRVYEKYVQLETAVECMEEFAAQQRMLEERGDRNRWELPLTPFKHPNGNDVLCADTFDTQALGYRYDSLPPERPLQMAQAPTFALFVGMDPTAFAETSYTLHLFVFPTQAAADGFTPPTSAVGIEADTHYGGETSIFGGRGAECANCVDREPFDRSIDVTAALTRLAVSRHECVLKVVVEDDRGAFCGLDQVPSIPAPVLTGPIFESMDGLLAKTDGPYTSDSEAGPHARSDTRALQVRLKELGFFSGECDGWYGPATTEAVREYQAAFKLTQDSIAGPKTKGMLLQPLNDAMPHVGAEHDPRNFASSRPVTYWVGQQPGYLPRDRFLAEVAQAFGVWDAACGLTFVRVEAAAEAVLQVTFASTDPDKDIARFGASDGAGGMLAHATEKGVMLDPAERWVLRGKHAKPARARASYELLTVLAHEIGHVLGLKHSFNPKDIMYPYYAPGRARLSKAEKTLIASLYPKRKGGKDASGKTKTKTCTIL